jgi:uncharacterized membrane protein YoaK (UPF0700 family)
MSTSDRPADAWLSFGLAFIGGYGDAASFVLAKTFTGHVTGNLVLGAIGNTAPHEIFALKVLVFRIRFVLLKLRRTRELK